MALLPGIAHCAVVGSRIIVAGGGYDGTRTTEVLNLGTKTISHGPDMIKPRNRLYLITLQGSRTLALGGQYKDGSSWIYLDEVEELMEDNTWRVVGRLEVARSSSGGLAVPTSLVCGETV